MRRAMIILAVLVFALPCQADEIPASVIEQIKQKAISEWPNDYGMQEHTIKREVGAYQRTRGQTKDVTARHDEILAKDNKSKGNKSKIAGEFPGLWNKIRVGMSFEDVEAILGKAKTIDVYRRTKIDAWYFNNEAFVLFRRGKVTAWNPPKEAMPRQNEQAAYPYRIVAKEDISSLGRRRMVFRVVVQAEGEPKDDLLKQIAQQVWSEEGSSFDESTVFCYLPDMNTSGVAYAVARFSQSGLREFRVTDFIRKGRKEPASVPRLDFATRKRIFTEVLAAEDRAYEEATQAFPMFASDGRYRKENLMPQVEQENQLMEKYRAEVRQKYGLTEEEQAAISCEGVTKGW